mgnify:CR=1 FL=1
MALVGKCLRMNNWFTVERIDSHTFAISEYKHWEETHCYLLCGCERAVLIDTGLGVSNIKCIVDSLTNLPVILQSTQNLEHWRQTLSLPCFYMTHRSCIVNLRFVNSIRKDTILLKYRDKELTAYLTRRRYTAFKDTYLWYMESVK